MGEERKISGQESSRINLFVHKSYCTLGSWTKVLKDTNPLKVHKIENFFDSDFGICVVSLLVVHK